MTTAHLGADRVSVAPGSGLLARRPSALLFVPEATAAADGLLSTFEHADDDSIAAAVTQAVVDASFATAPFVLLNWSDRLHVVALGAVEVHTDHPSLPMLSGAGSGSWVERSVDVGAHVVEVRCGEAASVGTDLRLGRVSASGFAAVFSGTPTDDAGPAMSHATSASATDDPPSQRTSGSPLAPPDLGVPVDADPPAPPTVPDSRAAATPEPTVDAAAPDAIRPIATDRLAALRAAMGAATAHVDQAIQPEAVEPDPIDAAVPAALATEFVDDEVTLAPHDPVPLDASLHGSTDDQAPFVAALRCGRGHLNPPQLGACRSCGDLFPQGARPETVRQPPLALLQLADGETIPIDRCIVIGRRPDPDAAQADERAKTVIVGDDPSISRTHLRIDVEDWALIVTDCGSRSGTAIVARPGEEPRVVEPWMPHELPIGARVFLGGPTSVAVKPVPTGRAMSTP